MLPSMIHAAKARLAQSLHYSGELLHGWPIDISFSFVSDSPNAMKKLRRLLLESGEYSSVFGCAPHCLNNLALDFLAKDKPSRILKSSVHIVKYIRNSHFLGNVFSKLCLEKYKTTYTLPLFTKTRWSTAKFMFSRLLHVKSALRALFTDEQTQNYDFDFDVQTLVLSSAFWSGLLELETFLEPICQCLGYLESDHASFSTVFACFIFLKIELVGLVLRFNWDITPGDVISLVHKRFQSIYSPSHCLAFVTDPMLASFKTNVERSMGNDFICLGQGSLYSQCSAALEQHALGDATKKIDLIDRFTEFFSRRDGLAIDSSSNLAPHLSWSLLDGTNELGHILSQLHRNPTGAAGGERNHKTGKLVHCKNRASLSTSKVEMQVAVTYNSSQLLRKVPSRRTEKFLYYMISSVDRSCSESKEPDEIIDDDGEEYDEDEFDSFAQILTDIARAVAQSEI